MISDLWSSPLESSYKRSGPRTRFCPFACPPSRHLEGSCRQITRILHEFCKSNTTRNPLLPNSESYRRSPLLTGATRLSTRKPIRIDDPHTPQSWATVSGGIGGSAQNKGEAREAPPSFSKRATYDQRRSISNDRRAGRACNPWELTGTVRTARPARSG